MGIDLGEFDLCCLNFLVLDGVFFDDVCEGFVVVFEDVVVCLVKVGVCIIYVVFVCVVEVMVLLFMLFVFEVYGIWCD